MPVNQGDRKASSGLNLGNPYHHLKARFLGAAAGRTVRMALKGRGGSKGSVLDGAQGRNETIDITI